MDFKTNNSFYHRIFMSKFPGRYLLFIESYPVLGNRDYSTEHVQAGWKSLRSC